MKEKRISCIVLALLFLITSSFSEFKMFVPILEEQILAMEDAEDGGPYLSQNTDING